MAAPVIPWLAPGKIKGKVAAALDLRRSGAALSLSAADEVVAQVCAPDSHVFALTRGQYSMIDLVIAALSRTGPADVAVWTWCIADYELQSLSDLLYDGRLRSVRLVIDRAGALRQRHFLAWFLRRFGDDALRITLSHAKIATVVAPGWNIVIRGSANLNANPRLEQIDVSNSADAVAMIEDVMAEIWARVSAIPAKSLEYGECSRAFAEVFGGDESTDTASTGGDAAMAALFDGLI